MQFPDGKGVEHDEIQGQRFDWIGIGYHDIRTELSHHFSGIMSDGRARSWSVPLDWVDHDQPIDFEPVKENEQLRTVAAYCVLSIAFHFGERANGTAVSTHSGCFPVTRFKGHRPVAHRAVPLPIERQQVIVDERGLHFLW